MSRLINQSRRRFLARTGLGLMAATAAPAWVRAMEAEMAASGARVANRANPNFKPDVELDLIVGMDEMPILSGRQTRVMRYTAKLLKGPGGSVAEIPGSHLGPLLRFRKGQKVRINLRNQLTEPHVTHWHGLHVPAEQDGHPMSAVGEGGTLVYEFEVLNRAGLNIYHPHPHEATASQVYYGLAGGIIVNDEEEARLGLPSGEYELPVIIQDKRFDGQNQMVYSPTMHDRMMGYYGDQILVNGLANVEFEVASRAYRLRFLNGSTARIYKLGWDDGTPITVIGVDGGLLEKPVTRPYVMLAPGERLDVWADFSGRRKGTELTLRSLPFRGVLPKMAERMMGRMGGGGMGHGRRGGAMGMRGGMGMMGGMGMPVGSDYPLFKIRVTRETGESPPLPLRLSTIRRYGLSDVANPDKPVPIGISEAPGRMLLNGRPYAHNDLLPSERIPVNTVQLIEIFHAHGGEGGGHGGERAEAGPSGQEEGMAAMRNGGVKGGMGGGMMGGGMGGGGMGGMMMFSMAHPIHLHGQPFQILSRTTSAEEADNYATVKEGLIDEGWKDTVLLLPGDKIRVIKPFEDFKGLFMFHCHNLEHEDMGMMREFLVE